MDLIVSNFFRSDTAASAAAPIPAAAAAAAAAASSSSTSAAAATSKYKSHKLVFLSEETLQRSHSDYSKYIQELTRRDYCKVACPKKSGVGLFMRGKEGGSTSAFVCD